MHSNINTYYVKGYCLKQCHEDHVTFNFKLLGDCVTIYIAISKQMLQNY